MSELEQTAGALDGIRVIDLTRGMAGPYGTMLLADLGAEVIKVEPLEGDLIRGSGPYAADDRLRAYGGYFQSINRNKKSIAVDLKAAEGVALVRRLAVQADVVVENFRAGVMERLGLSYESLREENPRLVYAAVRGFGDPRTGESPYVGWPAWDVVAQAMGGLMGITGQDAEHPVKAGPGVGDIFPGTLCMVGVLGAVIRALRTGRGQFVDVAMYDGILSLSERIIYQYSYLAEIPEPLGNLHPIFAPFDIYPTRDGWVAIAAATQGQWVELCRIMERPDLLADARFANNAERVRNRDSVYREITPWAAARTKQEVMAALGGSVPAGPVNTAADIFSDPHAAARGMLVEVEHPGCDTPKTIVGSPVHMTETPPGVRSPAPILGQHTDEVLAALGYDEAARGRMKAAGVVVAATT